MVASILWAVLTLRSGLRLRSARRLGARRPKGEMRRHLGRAKPALVMIVVGYSAGLASAFWLRGWGVFTTAHCFVSTAALLLFVATGVLGRRLEKGRSRAVEAHAWLALAGVGAAVASFFTGFVLLP
ncbi:MAG: hypothetical protein JRH01_13120 [Deltaproteobacteria bacterium]|nr:hypothetical protein [Deltaproteobacteria bacterium]MBW2395566.1 hypothetical protein [Deltaproteobacteria bacterium]